MNWNEQFLALHAKCVDLYKSGNNNFNTYYTEEDLAFLDSIGYKIREFFDFIEDFCDEGAPSPSTALLIAAVRRDYLTVVQNGQKSNYEIERNELPTFGDHVHGIAYLPRIIKKAEAKLKGELDPDMMFGCGGDRQFLITHGDISLADFLRNVWASNGDTKKIADYIKSYIK